MHQNNGITRVLRIHLYTRNDQTGTIVVEEVQTAPNGSVLPKQYQIALNSVNTFIQNYVKHYPQTKVLQVEQPETATGSRRQTANVHTHHQNTAQDPMAQMSTSSLGELNAYDKYDLSYSSIDSNAVRHQPQQQSVAPTQSQRFSSTNANANANCRA
jgi:hypothetical protein